jgi:hypothetical protein
MRVETYKIRTAGNGYPDLNYSNFLNCNFELNFLSWFLFIMLSIHSFTQDFHQRLTVNK